MARHRGSKKRKFCARVITEDQNGNIHNRKVVITNNNPRKAYAQLKDENGVIDIESFEEVKS